MRKIFKWYTEAFILILPLFFLPVVVDSFGFGKNWLLVVSGLVGLVMWLVMSFSEKKWTVRLNGIWWLMLAGVVWAWAGWVIKKVPLGVKMVSIMTPMGMGTALGLLIWVFLWLQARERSEKPQVKVLTMAGLVMAITSLVVFLLPTNKLPISWPKDNPLITISSGWSITGSLWGELVILGVLLFEWMKRLLAKLKENEKEVNAYVGEAAMVVFFTLILVLDIFRVVGLKGSVLDLNSSWVIATEALKRSPWFGMGLGNYVSAFNLFRPSSFNMTEGWTSIFGAATMGWMQLWTELGLGGLILAGLGVMKWLKMKKSEVSFWEVGAMMAMIALMPLSLAGLWIGAWLVANRVEGKEYRLKFGLGEGDFNVMPVVVTLAVMGGVGVGAYWSARIMAGELLMRKSLLAASRNLAGDTYNLQIKAIEKNQYVPGYRRIYSQTNMALAQAILAKKDLTDTEKKDVSSLIEQAAREAKAAVALDPGNYVYWVNLASIYKGLIGLVDGALDWSYQAYNQAVGLDPVNPVIRVDLGGLLYAAGRIDEADRVFEQAVLNKTDMANAWYNWAYTAKAQNKLGDAVTRLTQAMALVPVDSGDYDKASKELDVWKKELNELIQRQNQLVSQQQARQAETLKTPEALPTGGEKVEVPKEDLEPPQVTPAGENTGAPEATGAARQAE
jgi:tetratricopeptide (TPR) repeat protein